MKKNKIAFSFEYNKSQRIKINLGIEILRFLLCFWIVIFHCSYVKKEHRKYLFKPFHVPTFFVISFYFYYPIISNKNIDKIISRFQRLLLPYIFWPFVRIIFVITNNFKEFTLKNIFLQLLLSFPIHCTLWFLFSLIFLSLFFAIILFAFSKNGKNILIFIGLFCYYLHLSGLVYNLLTNYKRFFRMNIGCLLEFIPLAVIGSILRSKNLLFDFKSNSYVFKFFLFFLIFILFEFNIFLNKPGFRYSNVSLNIISSLTLFLFFGTLDFQKTKKNIYIIIKYITQFTGGIYYTHQIVNDYYKKYFFLYLKTNYSSALIIYIICFFICFFGNKLFKEYKLKYLFL